MVSINYQIELDKMIDQCQQRGAVPTLLLHSCCAPCSSYVLEYLSDYFHITVFFFNPNIFPEAEYNKRVVEQKRLIAEMKFKNPVELIEGDYQPDVFFHAVKGYEQCHEGGERCMICYAMRLQETVKVAKEKNFDYFSTTLTISPLKKADALNSIGLKLQDEYGVQYLVSDFKKKNGYKRSIELSREYELYRQKYCGCIFSQNIIA